MHRIASDWRQADLSPTDQALCRFAEKLTASPEAMGREDVEKLRVADALGVEPEGFVKAWEQPPGAR